jgi:hypothetical protein
MAQVQAATSAEAGMVKTQAPKMRLATPQRTAETRLLAPTPMIRTGDHVGGRQRHTHGRGGVEQK